MTMIKILCIYHGNCADGFGAAWTVRQKFGEDNVEFHAATYQDAPPDVTGRQVLIVDFSYKRAVLEKMGEIAKAILVLDHHKSAAEDLSELPAPKSWGMLPDSGVAAVFDMERSGAGLTWDYFMGTPRPPLINHIEDRDLWTFDIPKTRQIQANLFSYPYDFEVWDTLMTENPEKLAVEGEAIERKHFKDIGELVKVVTRPMKIGGHVVPVANLPYTLTSDAGHKLAEGYPFAGCYWDTPDGRVFSLRSHDDGADVSEIAKQYGGGGHEHASRFRVKYDDLKQFEC